MNLKEAYRYQNVMTEVLTEAISTLSHEYVVTTRKCTNLLSKVDKDMQDESYVDQPVRMTFSHLDKVTELAEFAMYVLKEKETLARAIRDAKAHSQIDMDAQVGLNALRQRVAKTLRGMNAYKTEERTILKGGRGYRFDANGNQVEFLCDQTVVRRINFDRDKVRKMMDKIENESNMISTLVDSELVNSEVYFAPSFSVNDSFEEMFEHYLDIIA